MTSINLQKILLFKFTVDLYLMFFRINNLYTLYSIAKVAFDSKAYLHKAKVQSTKTPDFS